MPTLDPRQPGASSENAQPKQSKWEKVWETYGNDHKDLLTFMNSYPEEDPDGAVLAEVISINNNGQYP